MGTRYPQLIGESGSIVRLSPGFGAKRQLKMDLVYILLARRPLLLKLLQIF